MTVAWPAQVPLPTIAAYQLKPRSNVDRTEAEIGPARQRRKSTRAPTAIGVQLKHYPWQQALFEAWHRVDAQDGAAPFDVDLLFPIGLRTVEATFTDKLTMQPPNGGRWSATATLEVLDRPMLTATELQELLDEPLDAPLAWPSALPLPVFAGYQLEPRPSVDRSEIDAGTARPRRRSLRSTTEVPVQWQLGAAEAPAFEAWHRWRAREGAAWFAMPLLGGTGLAAGDARFMADLTLAPLDLGSGRWTASGTLELRERALLPAEPDAEAWWLAVAENGGSVSAPQKVLVTTLVAALKAGGSWALTDDYWLLVAENSMQALTSLKQRRLATATNSPTFTASAGYTFDGSTSYIDTGFVCADHAGAMSTNSARLAVYERTELGATSFAAGVVTGSSRTLRVRPRTTSSNSSVEANCSVATFTLPVSDSRGYFSGSRDAAEAGAVRAFKNGTSLTRTGDPTGFGASLPTNSIFLGGYNNVGAYAGGRASTLGLAAVGAALTSAQELAEYNAIQAYMTAKGANV